MSNITQQLTEVLARMTGMAELDALDARSNEWRSAIIDANQFLAAYDAMRAEAAADCQTAEPWIVAEEGDMAGVSMDETPIYDANGAIPAACWPMGEDFNEGQANMRANARRIVACVNACIGIPTEVLESQSTTPAS